jgi:DNA-binding XRE family transcriptional regulator
MRLIAASEDVLLKQLGNRIRKSRLGLRMFRTTLGKRVGLSVYMVDQLEAGHVDADILTVIAIAEALSVPPMQLFCARLIII